MDPTAQSAIKETIGQYVAPHEHHLLPQQTDRTLIMMIEYFYNWPNITKKEL